jgi:transposase
MARWAQPLRSRDQIVLFAPTLQETIPEDHPVRLFDEVLASLDFSDWELGYCQTDGQPPIHPRVMAAVILYGLSLGIRPSRKLEDACGNRLDFIWLAEGRVIDHSTLAGFRVKFEKQLKGLFRQVGRVAIGMGMANLNTVALDGTVKRASNGRGAVAGRKTLEQKLAVLDQQVEELMAQAKAADKKDDELFGESSPAQLPKQLKKIEARQKQLKAALKKVKEIEARQEAKGRLSDKGPVVPVTDPDCGVMKNKTGGTAPNYLVVLATEGKNGLIMDYQVSGHDDEPASVMPAMENLKEAYGSVASGESQPPQSQPPQSQPGESQPSESEPHESPGESPKIQPVKKLLADTNFNTGSNLAKLTEAGIEPWMPEKKSAEKKSAGEKSAVTPASLETADAPLPINPKTKALDKSAFTYDAKADAYHCPAGRSLPLHGNQTDRRADGTVIYNVYQSNDCGGCALAGQCLSGKNKLRTVRRDQHEPLREQMRARMKTDAGQAVYRQRSHLAETPFAVWNTTMNIRQLLLRGIGKVTTEIGWICTAGNLKKITRLLAAERSGVAAG